jgi:hypothetical protein
MIRRTSHLPAFTLILIVVIGSLLSLFAFQSFHHHDTYQDAVGCQWFTVMLLAAILIFCCFILIRDGIVAYSDPPLEQRYLPIVLFGQSRLLNLPPPLIF